MLPIILDLTYKNKAVIKKVINPWLYEEINGEYKFTFSAVIDAKTQAYFNDNYLVSIEDDYFQFISIVDMQNADGTLTVNVECEHISYILNNDEYDEAFFTSTGTVEEILEDILEGTPLTVGTVDVPGSFTYSAQERKSRRQILMEFADQIESEVEFNKLEVSMLEERGSGLLKTFQKGKNIKVLGRSWNKKELVNGQPKLSYAIEPIELIKQPIVLGDTALIIQDDIGIQEQLRVVRYGYNPVVKIASAIELGNFIDTVSDDFYRISTTAVSKEKVYNGCRIGPDEGFVAQTNDNLAKTVMNATEGISIFTGASLTKVFFVDTSGQLTATGLLIEGDSLFKGTLETTKNAIVGNSLTVGAAGVEKTIKFGGTGFNIDVDASDIAVKLGSTTANSTIFIANDGTNGKVRIIADGDIDLTADGDINLTAAGEINIDAPTVNINGVPV